MGSREHTVGWAALGALAFFGAVWGFWGTTEHSVPNWGSVESHAGAFIGLTLAGLALSTVAVVGSFRIKNHRASMMVGASVMLYLVLVSVVAKEPGNFYSVSAGVFASLVLALAAGWTSAPTTPAPTTTDRPTAGEGQPEHPRNPNRLPEPPADHDGPGPATQMDGWPDDESE